MIVPIALTKLGDTQGGGSGSGGKGYRLSALSASDLVQAQTQAQGGKGGGETEGGEGEFLGLNYIGTPVAMSSGWEEVVRSEVDTALAQRGDAIEKGFTLQIAKNGKVGSRKFGVPLWEPEE